MSPLREFFTPIESFREKTNAVILGIAVVAAASCSDHVLDTKPPEHIKATDGMFGGNVAGYDWGGTMNSEQVIEDLERIGARYIVFNPALYMRGGVIEDKHYKTPHLDDVRELAVRSKEAGLPMVFKPLVEVEPGSGYSWRGEIVPEDAGAWFDSYTEAVDQQYGAAYSEGARTLVIGTELSSMEGEEYRSHWEALIAKIDERYPDTKFVYNQNWDLMGHDPAFAAALDRIDYSIYRPVEDDMTLAEHWHLVAEQIKAIEEQSGIPRAVGEFGLALTGSLVAPNQEDKVRPYTVEPNPEIVALYIREACAALDEWDIPGALWGTYTHSLQEDTEHGVTINLDAQRGFYTSSRQNAELASIILEACST